MNKLKSFAFGFVLLLFAILNINVISLNNTAKLLAMDMIDIGYLANENYSDKENIFINIISDGKIIDENQYNITIVNISRNTVSITITAKPNSKLIKGKLNFNYIINKTNSTTNTNVAGPASNTEPEDEFKLEPEPVYTSFVNKFILEELETELFNSLHTGLNNSENKSITNDDVTANLGYEYYVKTMHIKDVDFDNFIYIGNTKYFKDETVEVAVNGNSVISNPYYTDNGNIYIAKPILLYEMRENPTITVNDENYLVCTVKTKELYLSNTSYLGKANSIQLKNDNYYKVFIGSATNNSYMKINYSGEAVGDKFIVKTEFRNTKKFVLSTITTDGAGIQYHLVGIHKNFEDVNRMYNKSEMSFSFYCVNKGMKKMRIYITLADL